MPSVARSRFVLDQNFMRERFDDFRDETAELIVPDVALVEMTKTERWPLTFRESFARIASRLDQCYMSISIQGALTYEVQHGPVSTSQLLPADFTHLLREMIAASQVDTDDEMIRDFPLAAHF